MAEEIKVWNPEDAINALRERIRLEFVQMIPAEQFTKMVRAAIQDFTTSKEHGYNSRDRFSDFDSVVRMELTEATKSEVKKLLGGAEWQNRWSGEHNCHEASDRVKEFLKLHGATILNNWLGSAFQNAISQIQSTFR